MRSLMVAGSMRFAGSRARPPPLPGLWPNLVPKGHCARLGLDLSPSWPEVPKEDCVHDLQPRHCFSALDTLRRQGHVAILTPGVPLKNRSARRGCFPRGAVPLLPHCTVKHPRARGTAGLHNPTPSISEPWAVHFVGHINVPIRARLPNRAKTNPCTSVLGKKKFLWACLLIPSRNPRTVGYLYDMGIDMDCVLVPSFLSGCIRGARLDFSSTYEHSDTSQENSHTPVLYPTYLLLAGAPPHPPHFWTALSNTEAQVETPTCAQPRTCAVMKFLPTSMPGYMTMPYVALNMITAMIPTKRDPTPPSAIMAEAGKAWHRAGGQPFGKGVVVVGTRGERVRR